MLRVVLTSGTAYYQWCPDDLITEARSFWTDHVHAKVLHAQGDSKESFLATQSISDEAFVPGGDFSQTWGEQYFVREEQYEELLLKQSMDQSRKQRSKQMADEKGREEQDGRTPAEAAKAKRREDLACAAEKRATGNMHEGSENEQAFGGSLNGWVAFFSDALQSNEGGPNVWADEEATAAKKRAASTANEDEEVRTEPSSHQNIF